MSHEERPQEIPKRRTNPKNIILIVMDAVRRDFFNHIYKKGPCELKKDFVNFNKCKSLYTSTSTSHYAIFFGDYFNKSKNENFPAQLKKLGFKTRSFCNGAIISMYPLKEIEENQIKNNRPFRRKMIEDLGINIEFNWKREKFGSIREDYYGSADDERRNVPKKWKKYIYENKTEKNFIFLHFWSAHCDYGINNYVKNPVEGKNYTEIGREILRRIKSGELTVEFLKELYSERISDILNIYIKNLIKILKENKMYEDSLIIITSDHGEGLGDIGKDYNEFLYNIYKKIYRYYKALYWRLKKKIIPKMPSFVQKILRRLDKKMKISYKWDFHTFYHAGEYEFLKKVPLLIKFPYNKFGGECFDQEVTLFDLIHTIDDLLDNKLDIGNTHGCSLYSLISCMDREKYKIKRNIDFLESLKEL